MHGLRNGKIAPASLELNRVPRPGSSIPSLRNGPGPGRIRIMERVLAIDMGGTKTAVGVVAADGGILSRNAARTPLGEPRKALASILELSRGVLASAGPAEAVGLALPGIVDRGSGVLLRSPSSGWRDVPFGVMVRDALGLPVFAENDVNACAWGEARFGGASGLDSFFWMTVSTGIGGAVLSEGRFPGGPLSGEIGHLVVNPGGRECGCGNRGCLEAEAAGPAWSRRARALLDARKDGDRGFLGRLEGGAMDARAVAEGARQGDPICLEVVRGAGEMLARGMAAVFNLLDPGALFLGGGVAGAFDVLEPVIRENLPSLVFGGRERSLRILPSALGYDAGLVGAASLAFHPYP